MKLFQAVLALSLLPLAAAARAQVTLAAPPMRPPAYLAKMPAVQTELGLTDEQKAKIEEAVPKPPAPPPRQSQELKQGGGERPEPARDPMNFETIYARVKGILTEKQVTRLEELNRQYYGVYSLTYPATAKEYGLSADQIERLTVAYTGTLEEVASESLVTENGVAKIVITNKGMAKASAGALADAKKILTPAQLKKFTDSLGAPFTFEDR